MTTQLINMSNEVDNLPQELTVMPMRPPLNRHTLSHIVRQCHSSAARQRVLRREVAITRANVAWGILSRADGIAALDVIRVVARGWS